MVPAVDPLIGRTLDGRYRIEQAAARGGMAMVYVATDLRLQRQVAVKVLHSELAGDPEFVKRFVRESRASAALTHPNVVAVHDQGLDSATSSVYLVMELVVGRTLRDVLAERGKLSATQALAVLDPVLLALSAAHAAGFVHRDVKPENVLIADTGQVKVADFGLARALFGNETNVSTRGVLIGTAAYLSPEQVESGSADARSDIYAAGVMLFEMLTGQLPHTGETPIALAFQHVHQDVALPSSVNSTVPPAMDALVKRATARAASLRYQDVPAFLADVRRTRIELDGYQPATDWQQTSVISADTNSTPQSSRHDTVVDQLAEPRKRRRRFGRTFVALLVVIGALAGWYFTAANKVSVPQLVGRTLTDAKSALRTVELHAKVERKYSDSVAVDIVMKATPSSGSSADKGSEVILVISRGPKLVAVPDLTGQTYAEAVASLTGLGFSIGKKSEEFSDTVALGVVISADPASSELVKPGSSIDLKVSKGLAPITIPSVTGHTESFATDLLHSAGFTNIKSVTAHSETVAVGKVISISPDAGNKKQPDSQITLTISDGPPPVSVPSVLSMNWKLATSTLSKAHLNSVVTWNNKCGNKKVVNTFVMSQDPKPNAQVPRGATVTLQIAKACA